VVALCGLPMFHANGIMVTGLTPLYAGATVLLATPSGFRTPQLLDNFWRLVEMHRVTLFAAVPTIYAALLDRPVGDADLSSLRFGFCGAAPMPVELFRRFEHRTGVRILEGYGLTEATCSCTVNPPDGVPKVGSVGIRVPYLELKVAETDKDGEIVRECRLNEVGNLLLRGPTVFPGYKDSAANRGLFSRNGWFNTGDLARLDADGYVWLAGRSKDLIIRGGHNIDPALIEECLSLHPDVALVAAVGQPDAYSGELPMAYVTLRGGAKARPHEIRDWARQHIQETGAAPVRVVILDAMPLTAVGKIFKPALRVMAAEQVVVETLRAQGVEANVSGRIDKSLGLVIRVESRDTRIREQLDKFAFALEWGG
jgi:fatty-acyl-CoA synthase